MRQIKHGDTIVEVIFAITIFSLVAIISIGLMNGGIASAQAALELTMARNEIDAQAEALRFLHNGFLAERESSNQELFVDEDTRSSDVWYAELWRELTRDASSGSAQANGLANLPNKIAPFSISQCKTAYAGDGAKYPSIFNNHAFVLNTRMLTPNTTVSGGNSQVVFSAKDHPGSFMETPLYPRLVFTKTVRVTNSSSTTSANKDNTSDDLLEDDMYRFISRVEGIWVLSVRDATTFNLTETSTPSATALAAATPEYFDFHIRTCWYAPGRDIPTTIGTIIRLYNPEYVEASR